MTEIWSEWFGQGFSLPVIAIDLTFLGAGMVMGAKIKNRKAVRIIMLTEVLLFLICALLMLTGSEMVNVYAIYLGGMFTLLFAGTLIGTIIRIIKYRKEAKQ